MSKEPTQKLGDARSFEERVFARFDAMDARLDRTEARFEARFEAVEARFDALDRRLDKIETRLEGLDHRVQVLESRAYDTKPIWERALAEITEVKEAVYDTNRKIKVLNEQILQVRADQVALEHRMDRLESRPQ